MTNEEIVVKIKNGQMELMSVLWEQIQGLVRWKAAKVIAALNGRFGVDFDDLYQSGYLAMVEAVETYNPEGRAFSTWFVYYLKKTFAEATGYRTKKGRLDPLNSALSIDRPISGDQEDATLADFLADPAASCSMEAVEDSIYRQQLHEAIETVMEDIPAQYSEILRLRYLQEMTLSEVGEMKGVSYESVRKLENRAIREIRIPRNACRLRPFYDFNFFLGAGLQTFRYTGMSIQERYLVIEENREERRLHRLEEKRNRTAEEIIEVDKLLNECGYFKL